MTVTAAPAISIRGLTKSYRDVQVLRGVDLDVAPGSIVALLAPTGRARPPSSRSCPRCCRPTAAPPP